ncbi:hypothetical protein [Streptomyces albogriseolus]|uniref:hypothetical protein n=1 Tax=Streptomyces albogriseolus TaxID=1887 RepID=UPI00345FC9C5
MNTTRRARFLIQSGLAALAAVALAKVWPLNGNEVRADFFLSVSASVLTVFGLAFSMVLLSSDLGQARGRISHRHSFTWEVNFYLLLFAAIVLWCLLVAYAADGAKLSGGRLCLAADHTLCMQGRRISQISIGSTALLIFLIFPFIGFIYRGLSPHQVLADRAHLVSRSRSVQQVEHRIAELQRQTIAFHGDLDVKVLASATQALESASSAILHSNRRRHLWQHLAEEIIATIGTLNGRFLGDPHTAIHVIRFSVDWIESSYTQVGNSPQSVPGLTNRGVANQLRALCEIYNRNIRRYSEGELSTDVALESVRALNRVASICRDRRINLSFARTATDIVACLRAGPDAVAQRGLTGCLGGLMRLTATAIKTDADLNASHIVKELADGVTTLARHENYKFSPGFVDQFGRVCNPLILNGSGTVDRNLADATAHLPVHTLLWLANELERSVGETLAHTWELQVAKHALQLEHWDQAATLAIKASEGFITCRELSLAIAAYAVFSDAYTEGGYVHPGRIRGLTDGLRRALSGSPGS